jgi:hypothetical protein
VTSGESSPESQHASSAVYDILGVAWTSVCASPVTPGRNGHPWAFPWASHPVITDHARQRRGPVQDTDRSHAFDIEVDLPSTKLLNTCDIVSHRIAAGECTALKALSCSR